MPVDASLKHCRAEPPWSWCGERSSPDFGQVFAWPAARGAVALTFDRRGRHHALTVFSPVWLEPEVAIFGRHFDVVWSANAEGDA